MPGVVKIIFSAETQAALAAIQNFSGSLRNLVGGIAAGMASAFTVRSLVEFVSASIDAADEAGKAAQKIGMSAEAFSAYAYAARLADVGQGEFTIGMKTLAQQITSAARGQAESIEAFNLLRVGIAGTDGQLRTLEEVLPEIAQRFSEMPDGIQKTDLAVQLFGRSGIDLIPLLNAGAEGLRKLMEEARAAGVVISGDTAAAAEEFNDTMTRVRAQVMGVGLSLAQELLPYLQQAADALRDFASNTTAKSEAVSGFVGVLKGLALVVAAVSSVFTTLGRQIGINLSIGFEQLVDNVMTIVRMFRLWYDTLGNVLSRVLQLGLSLGALGRALRALATGDFAEAKAAAVEFKDQAADAMKGLGGDVADGMREALGRTEEWLKRTATRAKVWWEETADNVQSNWRKLTGTFDTLFGPKSVRPAADKPASTPPPAPTSTANNEQTKQLRSMLEQINEDYRQATQTKLQILEGDHAELLRLLHSRMMEAKRLSAEELANDEDFQIARFQLEETYARKRAELERELAEQRRTAEAGARENAASPPPENNKLYDFFGVSSSVAPYREQVNVGNARLETIALELAAQQKLADSASASEEQRLQAQNRINALIGEQIDTQRSVADAERSINAARVQASKTMFENMAALARAFGKQGFEIAKTLAIASATVSTAEMAVKAYKNGVELGGPYLGWLLGPAFAAAAAGAGAAQIATIAAQSPGFAEGGLVTGSGSGTSDSIQARLSNGEFVMKSAAVQRYGVEFMDAVNAGKIERAERMRTALTNLQTARGYIGEAPLTASSAALDDQAPGLRASGGAAAQPQVNVNAPPAQIMVVDNEAMAEQLVNSGRFRDAVIRHVRNARPELGFET